MKNNQKKLLYIALITIAIISIIVILIPKKHNTKANTLSINDFDIIYGSDSAKLTIFMFSSYNCVHCQRFLNEVLPEIKSKYIATGDVRFVIKLVDLTYNDAVLNSLKIATCINRYGNFEALNNLLLYEPQAIYSKEFKGVVDDLILKDDFVAECMLNGDAENYIIQNAKDIVSLNIKNTPTFIINNTIHKGFKEFCIFDKIIEKELLK